MDVWIHPHMHHALVVRRWRRHLFVRPGRQTFEAPRKSTRVEIRTQNPPETSARHTRYTTGP